MDLGTPLRGVQEVEQRMEQLPNEVTKQSPMVLKLGCGDCFAALAMTYIRGSFDRTLICYRKNFS
jgi:hypothetical protein